MNFTYTWIEKQIVEYSEMVKNLTNKEEDRDLRIIWSERLNTLQSISALLKLEIEGTK